MFGKFFRYIFKRLTLASGSRAFRRKIMKNETSTALTVDPSTSPSNRNWPASSKSRRGSSAKKPMARTQQAISAEQLGQVAGDVWRLLNNENGQNLTAIKKGIDAPNDLIVAAIGWLARENKLNFSNSGRSVMISLQ
jgi:Winged helix-turn-helix domain (DUF2582)